ncbi:protein OCTOPUS-like [Gastrolobium bilobum]|uniref:protein OCTOPUS-like n=1 Tax=Gastrolobium bilobum TaxID=150636 RepID=UPI002AB0A2B2|nr:protein OCTOPUS-like [Gastrolobium bilobum]
MTSKTHRFTTCNRHPTKPVTGFCAFCLSERLAGIESSSAAAAEPELRRTKSFSGRSGVPPSSAAVPEPRRRSCEVLASAAPSRSTLWDLFTLDDDEKKPPNHKLEVDSRRSIHNGGDAIRVCGEDDDEETKTMKEFIDLELRSRKNAVRDFRDIAGSFWDAASVFSKRLRKWKRKEKLKRNHGSVEEQGVVTRLRETQSEVGEYGLSLGRRSCDTDPRLSVDVGRFSFDAPRASWDGYLIGKTCRRLSPMVHVNGFVDDERVLVEEEEEDVNLESGEEHCPGGSAQTKHYYSDSQRRRRSFDRSNSRKKTVIGDVDELRAISNAKVSPTTTELFYGAKVLITEKDLKDANLKSPNNVQSDCMIGSASNDACDASKVDQKGLKKFHKWGRLWNKFGLVHRRREDKLGEEEYAAGDMVNKPIAESWQKLRRVVNGQGNESVSQKLIRSYSVSCRDTCRMTGLVNGSGVPEAEVNVLNGRQEVMVQRNRSVRYSPNNVDPGLLRFYLTPLKSYRRSRVWKE